MGAGNRRKLTKRQMAVLERIDRRVPIKVIAQELGVSETRINQHIRELKDYFGVASLNELVECYRAAFGEVGDGGAAEGGSAGVDAARGEATRSPLSESAYRKRQVDAGAAGGENAPRVDPGEIVLSDVMPPGEIAPWKVAHEPRIVPGALDGEHAVLMRFAAIVGIAFGILAAVVLTVTAAMALSEAMEGRAHVPVENHKLAG